jgi:hypothetical protein
MIPRQRRALGQSGLGGIDGGWSGLEGNEAKSRHAQQDEKLYATD